MPTTAQGLNAPLKWSGFDSVAACFEQRLYCMCCARCLKALSSHLPTSWDTRVAPRTRWAPLWICLPAAMETLVPSWWICCFLFTSRQVMQSVGCVLTWPPSSCWNWPWAGSALGGERRGVVVCVNPYEVALGAPSAVEVLLAMYSAVPFPQGWMVAACGALHVQAGIW